VTAAVVAGTAAATLLEACRDSGVTRYLGVPCSTLKRVFTALQEDPDFLRMPREDVAVGTAGGLMIGGEKPVVLMQNSGLGYCLNALTSFVQVYELPLHLVVGWRGGTGPDAVEHRVMGPATLPLFELLGAAVSLYRPEEPEPFGDFPARVRDHAPGINVLLVGGGL
jgi:sulfopyruvate decarboxylase subunit alpha